jgi:hypothetical protein
LQLEPELLRKPLTLLLAPTMRLLVWAPLLIAGIGASADSAGLYPPGLLPIINRANGLFSAGQYNDAARAYSEAIGTYVVLYVLRRERRALRSLL